MVITELLLFMFVSHRMLYASYLKHFLNYKKESTNKIQHGLLFFPIIKLVEIDLQLMFFYNTHVDEKEVCDKIFNCCAAPLDQIYPIC